MIPPSARPPPRPAGFDLLLAAALGAAQTLTYVHTGAWPLQMLAIAVLAWQVATARPRRAFLVGWGYGTAWLGAGTWWLFISLHTYGGLPSVLAVLAIFALSAFLSIYLGAAMAACARWRGTGPARDALLFGAVWLLAELARGVIFTGFPGSPRATPTWTGRWRRSRPGWGSTGSASWWRCCRGGRPARGSTLPAACVAWPGRRSRCSSCWAARRSSARGHFTAANGTLSVTLLQGNVAQDENSRPKRCRKRWPGPASTSSRPVANSSSRPRP